MTSAELAREGGVNVEPIRHYERNGLLPKAPRTAAGYRRFSGDFVGRLRFIRRAQELGFCLQEVKELLALRVKPGSRCADVRRGEEVKLADVKDKSRQLRAVHEALGKIPASCASDGPAAECTILEALGRQEEYG